MEGMNLLIIAVDFPKDAIEGDSLHAIQSKIKLYPNEIWIAKNIALLDLVQRDSIAPKLLADLRSHKLRYKLYAASDYPKPLAMQIEDYP
jgi:hypothetical protein